MAETNGTKTTTSTPAKTTATKATASKPAAKSTATKSTATKATATKSTATKSTATKTSGASGTKKPAAARKPAARKTTTTRSTSSRTSTARKPQARQATDATTPRGAQRARTTATKQNDEALQANVNAVKKTLDVGRGAAERTALTVVGATLEGRDTVVETVREVAAKVNDVQVKVTTRKGIEKELKARRRQLDRDLTRYEKRGIKVRNGIEADLKKTRTQAERELRQRREAVDKQLKETQTELAKGRSEVEQRIDAVVKLPEQVVGTVRERVAALA